MQLRMIALACVAIVIAPPQLAAADLLTYQTRLRSEASLFFAEVLPQLDRGHAACTFSDEWFWYPVEAEWVGVTTPLIAMDHGTLPAEILDPDGRETGWLCSQTEIDALVLEATQRVQRDGGSAEVRGYELTFPVFSENFDVALIVLANWQIRLFGLEDGSPPVVSLTGGGQAIVYERQNNHWILVSSHGAYAYH